jgi:microcin C transport system substrate-binding protein
VYAATGLPQGKELELLEPFRDKVPQEVFTKELTPPSTAPPHSLRSNLRAAKKMLQQAGWKLENGVLKNDQGEALRFEIILVSPAFERVMAPYVKNLEKLGVQANYRKVDPALYADRVKRFAFDMIVDVFAQSQSPGNEQRDFWQSASARRTGSRNTAGISDPVVDELVEAIVYAKTQDELQAACRALDRVLWYGYYVVPNWYSDKHRLAYEASLQQPDTLPVYYDPFSLLFTWWLDTK